MEYVLVSFRQLKTERERVAERMKRLGKKWEAEHLQWEERERQQEAEMKAKEMELLASDKKCLRKLEKSDGGGGGGGVCGIDGGQATAEKSPRKGEMNIDDFLKKERQLMLTRLKPKDKKFIPFTKDLRIVDAKLVSTFISFAFHLFIGAARTQLLAVVHVSVHF